MRRKPKPTLQARLLPAFVGFNLTIWTVGLVAVLSNFPA